jgi:hypothetical protein
MFSEQSIIDLLEPTGYNIAEFPDTQFDIYKEFDERLPLIYVGYSPIDSRVPGSMQAYSFLDLHGEELTQSFDVHIVCNKEDLSQVFLNVHGALVGKIPTGLAEARSTVLNFAQGGLIGKNNGTVHWLSRYRIGFPTLLTLI